MNPEVMVQSSASADLLKTITKLSSVLEMDPVQLRKEIECPSDAEQVQEVTSTGVESRAIHIDVSSGERLRAEYLESSDSESSMGTIVFVHGFCGNRRENGLFSALSKRAVGSGFNVLLYDWRGLGDSDGDFASTTFESHADDFRLVLEKARDQLSREWGKTFVVGFSLGAALVGDAGPKNLGIDAATYLSPAVRPNKSMWPRYNTEQIRTQLIKTGVVRKPGGSVEIGKEMLDSLREKDLGESALELSIPLLVCHGTADERIDYRDTEELVPEDDWPDFGYVSFTGASHSFRPDESNWRVLGEAISRWFTLCSSRQPEGPERDKVPVSTSASSARAAG